MNNMELEKEILLKSNDKSFHVLYYIIQQSGDTLMWHCNKENREKIINVLNLKQITLYKQLASLKQRGLLTSIGRGEYELNEEVFTKLYTNG